MIAPRLAKLDSVGASYDGEFQKWFEYAADFRAFDPFSQFEAGLRQNGWESGVLMGTFVALPKMV